MLLLLLLLLLFVFVVVVIVVVAVVILEVLRTRESIVVYLRLPSAEQISKNDPKRSKVIGI